MAQVSPDAFAFCGPSYLGASPLIDCERSLNLYPEPGSRASKTGMALIARPGLSAVPFANTGLSPVRAMWAGNSRLFSVGGTHVYEWNPNGTILTDYGAIPGSSGVGPCKFLENGTQLLVMDSSIAATGLAGQSGVLPTGSVFNVNPIGPAVQFAFKGSGLAYLDNFYLSICNGGGSYNGPNQVNCSNIGDGTTWNALNFVIRSGAADLVTWLETLNGLLYIFGQKNLEVWYNAGNAGFPFARQQGSTINLGLLSQFSVVRFYNSILFLGADDRGYAQVYMMQGLNPVRVSNFAVEYMLQQAQTQQDLPLVWAHGYQEAGHTFYVLNFPNHAYASISNSALVYDLTTGIWHERLYGVGGVWPTTFASVPAFPTILGDSNFVGDFRSGSLYTQGIRYPNDGTGNAILCQRVSPHVAHDNRLHRYNSFELDADVGNAQPTLDYSNDGGRSFLGLSTAMTKARDQIAPSAFKRYYARQLGVSRDRVFQVTVSSSTDLIRFANAYLDVD